MSPKITGGQFETMHPTLELVLVWVYAGSLFGTGEADPAPGLKVSEVSSRKTTLGLGDKHMEERWLGFER